MTQINVGRFTAPSDEGFVVFLIGMRVNKWWALRSWLPMFGSMPRMLNELYANPELGLKSHQLWFGRTTILVQYWQSSEKLIAYASAKDAEHLPAWKTYNRLASKSHAVGVWHETYVVAAGATENMYVNMPTFGFGKVAPLRKATGKLN